jgi:deoxycytidine triphosphate deaminase
MYLIDKEIKAKLAEINFECGNDKHQFDAVGQIQPCSVDLRLDSVFWKPKRKTKSIDLRKSKLLELSSRSIWHETNLKEGEHIEIKPGEFILGRTYEKYTIPKDCAGKLEGRSSISRLGLAMQIGSDFINPDWRGHMPLQLVNYSKTTIKIYPYIPICQLMFIKLNEIPERLYGEEELQSKYMEDDGGPSYWWRDKRIKSLQETFHKKDIALNIQENILASLGVSDPDIIYRFEKFASKLNKGDISNTDWALQKFTDREKIWQRLEDLFIRGTQVAFVIMTGNSLRLIFGGDGKITTGKVIAWVINAVIAFAFVYSFFYDKKNYFTPDKLDKSKSK